MDVPPRLPLQNNRCVSFWNKLTYFFRNCAVAKLDETYADQSNCLEECPDDESIVRPSPGGMLINETNNSYEGLISVTEFGSSPPAEN
jgi:hypothetical protein